MILKSICSVLFFLFFFYNAVSQTLNVSYYSGNQEIVIENEKLTKTETVFLYSNPVSDSPDSTYEKYSQSTLSQKQKDDLITLIEKSGFFDLDCVYGATEGMRFYLYQIDIELNGKKKQVIFRSNPSFTDAPKAFRELEEKIIEYSK